MRLPSSDDSDNSSDAALAIDDESQHSSDTESEDGARPQAWSDSDASSSSDDGDDAATAEAWPPPPPGPGSERPLFAPSEERDMISWLGQCDALGLVVTKEHFTEEVLRIVQMEQRSSCTLEELTSWVSAFSTRLTVQLGRATTFTSLLPAAGAEARRSAPAPGPWYESVRAVIAARYPDVTFTSSESVFYLGETNLRLDPASAVVCAVQEECRNGAKDLANVARLAAVAASGEQVPAMWVTPGNGLVRHNPPPEVDRCLLQTTSNGQVTSSVLMTYLLKVFEPYLQSHLVPRPVLLYVNGLDSHCSMAVSQFCDDERILLVGLPPGGQTRNPLQSAVGSLLSANFDRLAAEARLGRRKAEGGGMTASLSNIIAGFSQATRRCCKETIRQAFIASSLFPWTEDVIAACQKTESPISPKTATIGSAAKKTGATAATKAPAPADTPHSPAPTGTPKAPAPTGTHKASEPTGTSNSPARTGNSLAPTGTPKASVSTGTHKALASTGTLKALASTGTPKALASTGTPKALASTGTPKALASTGALKSPAPTGTPSAPNQLKRARAGPANNSSKESKTNIIPAKKSSVESEWKAITSEVSKVSEAHAQSGEPPRRPNSYAQCTEMPKISGANAASAAAHKAGIVPALRMEKCSVSAKLCSPSPGEKAAKRPVVTVRNEDGTVSVAPVSLEKTGTLRAATVGLSGLAQEATRRSGPGATPSHLLQVVEQRTVTLMNESGAPVKKAIMSVSKNFDNVRTPPNQVIMSGNLSVPQVRLVGTKRVQKQGLAPAEEGPAHWSDAFAKAAERNGQAPVASRQQTGPTVAPSRPGIVHGQCEEGEVTIKTEALSPPPAGEDGKLADWRSVEPETDGEGPAPGPVVLPQARLAEYLHALDTAEVALHQRPHSAALILELKGKLHALHTASARLSPPPPPPPAPPPPPPKAVTPAANGTAAPWGEVPPRNPPRGTRCAVRGCGRRSWNLHGEPSMYPFPTSAAGIRRWLEACRQHPDTLTTRLYVCDLHFMPTDFSVRSSPTAGVGSKSKSVSLRPEAVPHRLLSKRGPPPPPLKSATQASVSATTVTPQPPSGQSAERHLRGTDGDARRGRGIKRPRRFDDFHWEDPFTGKADEAGPSGGPGGDGAVERPQDSGGGGMEELANKQPSALKSIIRILREENRELRDRVELVERRGAALARGMAGLMEEYERGEAG